MFLINSLGTPVLVNKLGPVVEYLGRSICCCDLTTKSGTDYPFYYESFREAADKATDIEMIQKAHQYLKNLDKKYLTMKHFWESLASSSIYQSICNSC
jgi:hypothetical protein